jgi:transcriptional regulator with GAF, ATPase, and Fis domain
VAVADTLTTDFDIVDLLHTLVVQCTEIVATTAGGLMLVDGDGTLQLMTSTSEAADLVELMQLAASEGPCIDCFTTGQAVSVPNIEHETSRWPAFRKAALEGGFHSAHATPLKLRGTVIGTMNLFGVNATALSERDAAVAQALADVATIGILQERLVREGNILAEQLHAALDSRIVIEQAKGMIAHSLSVDMDEAFGVLRTHARNNNLTIRDVADSISNRRLSVRRTPEGISIVSTSGGVNRQA